jgi:hypothetical protein
VFAALSKDLEPFARGLAKELSVRIPPSRLENQRGKDKSLESAVARAMDHVTLAALNFRSNHQVGLFKRLLLTRSFQSEMASHGYEGDFIREATFVLVRALTTKKQ